jgi:monomeric sarcosine oxidase
MKPVDVAIVGAGVFGAWSAWHLEREGCRVALVDAYGAANNRASSGGESRIIRMGYGADEIYTRSAMRSLELWSEFAGRSESPLFYRTGVLWATRPDDPYAASTRRTLSACGVPHEVLDAQELCRRYAQIRYPEGAQAILEPASGALMARRAVQSLVAGLLKKGVAWLPAAVAPTGGPRAALRTSAGDTISSGTIVFACGPWLPKIFPALLGRRIFPTRQDVYFFGVPAGDTRFAPPALPVWTYFSDEAHPYGFPDLENRGLKIALDRHGPPFDPDTGDRLAAAEAVREIRTFLARYFPALADAPLLESRVCQYENTSNGDFLIDRHPEFDNVWLVGGGSGHGFKHGPAVGEYLAARILRNAPPEPRYALAAKAEVQRRTVY